MITFDCGGGPATIVLTETAKVFNNTAPKLVIDGGNKITLSGGGAIRILYMSTCDKAQRYPAGSGDCNTNPGVQLVVQNITFVDGNARNIDDTNNAGGGGATYAQGGSLKVVNSRFFNNVGADLGSDVGGGGAIRILSSVTRARTAGRSAASGYRGISSIHGYPSPPRSVMAQIAVKVAMAARSTTTETRLS